MHNESYIFTTMFFNICGLVIFIIFASIIYYIVRKFYNARKYVDDIDEKFCNANNGINQTQKVQYSELLAFGNLSLAEKEKHMAKHKECKSMGYQSHYEHKLEGLHCGSCNGGDCVVIEY